MKDPGLQPERTSLAWGRTALSMLVAAVMWLKMGSEAFRMEIAITGLVLLVAALCACGAQVLRSKELLSMASTEAPSGYLMSAMAAGVSVCAAGSVLIFLSGL